MNNRRPVVLALLIASLIGGAAIVFLPIGWQLNRFVVWLYYFGREQLGVPEWVPLLAYDFGLNVLLFFVPVLLLRLALPQIRGWWALAGAVATTLTIELVQGSFLPRQADWMDVAANTLGAVLAVAITYPVLRLRRPRPRRAVQPDPRSQA